MALGLVFLVILVFKLGSANTQYNRVVMQEAARVKQPLLVKGCLGISGGETSQGNLDANEEYDFDYTCNPLPKAIDQLVSKQLTSLGYSSQGSPTFTNNCCRISYSANTERYSIDLVDKNVSGSN